MASFGDYEFLFPLNSGPVRVFVTKDEARTLGSIVDALGQSDEVRVLLYATAADVAHDEHVDSQVIVNNLVRDTQKFIKGEPTAEVLEQFRDGLLAWIRAQRDENVGTTNA